MAKKKPECLNETHVAALAGVALVATMFWLNVLILNNAPTGAVAAPNYGCSLENCWSCLRSQTDCQNAGCVWTFDPRNPLYNICATPAITCDSPTDNIAETGEYCDGTDLRGRTCQFYNYGGGTLKCKNDCTFDLSSCTEPAMCGNNIVESGEACDGTDFAGRTCTSELGPSFYGTLKCKPDCYLNTSDCRQAVCGNNVADPNEDCDGTDLGGKTCTNLGQGFTGGTLKCRPNCVFNTSQCFAAPSAVCGNNILETGEDCDTTKLGGQTCAGVLGTGYTGTLGCADDCSLDTSGCVAPTTGPTCGDGFCDTGESATTCPEDCTAAAGLCGNGVIESGEECDMTKLGGQTCKSLGQGFTGGTLACAEDCFYDTSGCTAPETEVTSEQALTSINGATIIISEMKKEGKNTSEAAAMLKEAITSYNSGQFAEAKRQADMAKITAMGAEELQKPAELPITAIAVGALVIAVGGGLYYAKSKGLIKIGKGATPQNKHAKAGAQA